MVGSQATVDSWISGPLIPVSLAMTWPRTSRNMFHASLCVSFTRSVAPVPLSSGSLGLCSLEMRFSRPARELGLWAWLEPPVLVYFRCVVHSGLLSIIESWLSGTLVRKLGYPCIRWVTWRRSDIFNVWLWDDFRANYSKTILIIQPFILKRFL